MKSKALQTIAFILLCILILWPEHAALLMTETEKSWCVSVWYPSSEDPTGNDSIMNNLDVIHEVNPFWYSPAVDGTLDKHADAEDPRKLVAWRDAGLAIVPTIVSFELSAMIEDPQIREQHIANIVALVEEYDYDGIDIDYEGFALRTRDAFSTFIEDLATALHARGRLLSMAVHAKTSEQGNWAAAAAQDWTRLTAAVDIFRIMTYDYHSRAGESGPIGPVVWVRDVLAYAASITSLEKVRMGLHFYGYTWQRRRGTTITWAAVQQWVESFDLAVVRDPADMEARIELDVRGLPRQTIYVADAEGLSYKLNLILAAYPELGGVAIWGLGGEDPANWDILRGIKRTCTFFAER